jgi:hypothetical protein
MSVKEQANMSVSLSERESIWPGLTSTAASCLTSLRQPSVFALHLRCACGQRVT